MINIDADHIVELQDGGAKLDRSNVMLRCRSCHGKKTAQKIRDRREVEFYQRRVRLRGGESKIPESDPLTTAP